LKEKNEDVQNDRVPEEPAIRGTDLTLRPYRDGDANRVLSLMREVFIDEMGWDRAFLVDAARTLKEILDDHMNRRDLFLVCLSRARVVGVLILIDVGGDTGFIRWLVVHREARGIGLGRLLLERALSFARDAGFARFRLVTVDDLPRALNFYLKAGFSEMGRRPDIIWRTYHDLCFMEKEVTP
jgi:ribosomal protein S18 acetylase RimI-like enzyme